MVTLAELGIRKIFAIIIPIILVAVICLIVPSAAKTYIENINLQNARTFHVVIGYNYNELPISSPTIGPDILIDLTISYPRGTLIVDDPVTISGVAILNSDYARKKDILSFTLGFQNSQFYPVTQNIDGITKESNLILSRDETNSAKFIGSTILTWTIEGSYRILASVTNTTKYGLNLGIYLGQAETPTITVYPKTQYAQLLNNNTTMIFTFTAFILTLIGTLNLVFYLWDWSSSKEKIDETKSQIKKDLKKNLNKKSKK